MRNLKFIISYKGSNYHGFQIQPNSITIQGELENALLRILSEKAEVIGCSRTDAGVHARQFCFNTHIKNSIPTDGLMAALNAILPKDIAVHSCEEADINFHARYDAKGKEYLYRVYISEVDDVFAAGLALRYRLPLNVSLMNEVAGLFIGEHDFGAFCKAEAKVHLKSTVRKVTDFKVIENGSYDDFYISGTGFLHNMVRILVGTLIYVSEGKRTGEDIIKALKTGKREIAGKTIPPDGLYLNKIIY